MGRVLARLVRMLYSDISMTGHDSFELQLHGQPLADAHVGVSPTTTVASPTESYPPAERDFANGVLIIGVPIAVAMVIAVVRARRND